MKSGVQNLERDKLETVGLVLYWAEGTKSKPDKKESQRHIEFISSDPVMVKIFMDFLRDTLKVPEHKFRCRVQSIRANVEERARRFWSEITKVPISQFTKSRIKGGFAKDNYVGCCTIKVHSKKLKAQLDEMLLKFMSSL